DRAAIDGYAVRAAETVGAGDYNPLPIALADPEGRAVPPGRAALVVAGAAPPEGTDAILPFEAVQKSGLLIEILAAAAPGAGIERKGQQHRAGAILIEAGRVLRPQDLGILAALGVERLRVCRRPRIRVIIAPATPLALDRPARDANGAMLKALVARDGGTAETTSATPTRKALADAIARPGADAVLVAGRTGAGPNDEAPLALAEAGILAFHGVALRPGGSVGMGLVGTTPVILLPGDPLACLCAYDLLAGRLVRRLGGRSAALPYVAREIEIARKIVSAIGFVDCCRVRLEGGRAEPLGSADTGGLAAAVRADGFVLVPEALEGYAAGSRVTVYIYDTWTG
ncbi:MAG: molybdopterin biosynthesis protein, partial [Alphaproteobacteria bacterium]|nr:molybdopterin biosynthesis protein [Alphaproteobacteria bacterium]